MKCCIVNFNQAFLERISSLCYSYRNHVLEEVSFFICLNFTLLFECSLQAGCLHVDIAAPIAIVIDADSGKVLFEKKAKVPCYPASTTKIATALYALYRKEAELSSIVVASREALATVSSTARRSGLKHPPYRLEFGGTHIGAQVGEELSFEMLLYGLMLASGNDAANIIAEGVSGSVSRFMEELNLFLQTIGCTDTHFTNPHGLPDASHVTTALDLAHMARVAMKVPLFRQIVGTRQYERKATNKQLASLFAQGNALLRPGSKYFYPYATGIKTGYTAQSGYNIVASASRNGRNVIVVVCQCEDIAKRYKSIQQLFEMVFQEPKQARKLLCQEYDVYRKMVSGAKTSLEALLEKDVIIEFYPSEEKEFFSRVVWKDCNLPIAQGDVVGFLEIFDEREDVIQKVALLAKNDIAPTVWYQLRGNLSLAAEWLKEKKALLGYVLACFFLFLGIGHLLWNSRSKEHPLKK